jgi:phospholipase C
MDKLLSRRGFLGAAAAIGAGVAAESILMPGLARAASLKSNRPATLDDIEHVVILMQENRSFDEYFGHLSDVIGFSDPNALPGVFRQLDVDRANNPEGYVLPWRMDVSKTSAQVAASLNHEWFSQHLMWNEGLMDQFLVAQFLNPLVMGYFTRFDVPYHCALADAFTLCDGYHCSALGPTDTNRLYLMSGTLDPGGLRGGPIIDNNLLYWGQLRWESFPETLQAAGVDWYVYQEPDNFGDNMLPYFQAFTDKSTDLYRRGNSFIRSTSLLGEATAMAIKADVMAGTLPQVSYIVGAHETTEHPEATPGRGAQFIDQILQALTSNPEVWAKTLFILNYDENDGHFDHVIPPTPPWGTEGEYLFHVDAGVNGATGPVGLGFRVPLLLISPFTTGPLVCSDVFDHTSVIKFLERKFNVHCPNISDWRRETVGDLTSAINFAGPISTAVPKLPDTDWIALFASYAGALPPPKMPTDQSMPTQETTPVRGRPSGLSA